MKVTNITIRRQSNNKKVLDTMVDWGYLKTRHGSLPDIDSDFDSERREDVKKYLETRYNKEQTCRVFSAGAYTTEKLKSCIKDVARTHKIPQSVTNYLTAMFDDDSMTWTDLMKLAVTEKKIRDYIQKYPEVFEEILPLMGQARAATIHPSAVIVTPEIIKGEKVECFDILPIRLNDDLLVSEISGAEIDAIGILKCDILAIRELNRLANILKLVKDEYGVEYTILEIASKYGNDDKVFEIIRNGNTQGIFQMSGEGITKSIKRMKPDCIQDIIASVALFRPGPLKSGATDNYIRAKRGEYEPSYLWGTYETLKETYGEIIYQESVSQIVREVGSLTLGDGVTLVKAISKKKLADVQKFKNQFFEGAKKNGCPEDAAKQIWVNVENATSYLFNKSHATAYGLTAYIGGWLKAHYPTAFYTVVLRDHDEKKMAILMNEIEAVGGTKLEQADINISDENFTADFKNNKIYWSLSRIKQLGPKAVTYIVQERKLYGDFYDMEDFIKRIFKNKFKSFEDEGSEEVRERCPVTARSVRQLIFAGAFDRCENVGSVMERYGLLEKAANLLGFKLSEKEVPEDMRNKHYFWSRQQIAVSGHGSIDYKRIYDNADKPKTLSSRKYIEFRDLNNLFFDVKVGVICASITSVTDKSYKDRRSGETKHFGKIELQQNTETNILTIWDEWPLLKKQLKQAIGKMIIAVVNVKWSDYDEKNTLSISKNAYVQVI